MSNIDDIFRAALLHSMGPERGAQARLARSASVHPPHLNRIIKGGSGADEVYRKIASALGYPARKYEDFLDIGRAILEGKEPPEPEPHLLTTDEMADRSFIAIPFSQEMKLAAGGGGTIPITEDEDSSPVIVHGPSLGLRNAKYLQAFRVGGDSMEPLIAKNGIVLADLSQNNIINLHEGKVYVLCWDRDEGECAVKRLRWADKDKGLLLIESEDRFYPPVVKGTRDIVLIGKVIWSWREHR